MARLRILIAVCSLLLCLGAFAPLAQAGISNQRMEFKFNEPIAVPGYVLPAGAYWFVLFSSDSDRQIVQIYSPDRTKLYGTFLMNAVERETTPSHPEIEVAERSQGNPEALLKMFYPSLRTGHEFVYPPKQEARLAQDAKQDIVVHRQAANSVVTVVGM